MPAFDPLISESSPPKLKTESGGFCIQNPGTPDSDPGRFTDTSHPDSRWPPRPRMFGHGGLCSPLLQTATARRKGSLRSRHTIVRKSYPQKNLRSSLMLNFVTFLHPKRSFPQVYVFSVFSLHGGAGSLGQVRAGIKAVKG